MHKCAIIALTLTLLTGCGEARMSITKPPTTPYHSPAYVIQRDPAGTGEMVDGALLTSFERHLEESLTAPKGPFSKGEGLTLRYNITDTHPGSRFARWFLGFESGEGDVTIKVEFLDRSGAVIAEAKTVGTVTGGWWGGSYSLAFENAADEIASYASRNFCGK